MAQTNGSLEFRMTMDPDSLDIVAGDKRVGMLQFHEQPPRVVLNSDVPLLIMPVSMLEQIVSRSKQEVEKRAARRTA